MKCEDVRRNYARFEVLIAVFYYVTTCSLLRTHYYFAGA
jgi:hypothetical protein